MQEVESEADRTRQSERTVDNLKRLYAVLFALSFAVLAQGVAEKLTSVLSGEPWTFREAIVHVEMTIVFALTAGLFYYQSDRVLDVALARKPPPDVSAWQFAGRYLGNVVTMAPFYLMAFALDVDQSRSAFGFNWYILAYIVLIGNGLFLLFLGRILGLWLKRVDRADGSGLEALTCFWLGWNSLMLLAVVGIFYGFTRTAGLCVAGTVEGYGWILIGLVGLAVLLRDVVDFWHGWPILYPVKDTAAELRRRRALAALVKRPVLRRVVTLTAFCLTVASVWLLIETGVFDKGALRAACAPTALGQTTSV